MKRATTTLEQEQGYTFLQQPFSDLQPFRPGHMTANAATSELFVHKHGYGLALLQKTNAAYSWPRWQPQVICMEAETSYRTS